jgi:FkbM family methyltransferase
MSNDTPQPSHATQPATHATLAGVRLNLEGLDPEVQAAIVEGRYEAPELHALDAALRPGDTVLELGTGIGLLSTVCARRVGGANVHTFEANPALEPRIRETWALNGVSPSLTMAMLGEHAGEHDFHVHEAFWASSATDAQGSVRTVNVPVRPLNEEIRRIDPSVLVMDIEGGEAELLRFADLHRIERIVAEFHERMLGREAIDAMLERLYGMGFRIVRDVSSWEVALLERGTADDPRRHVPLDEFLHGRWRLGGHWAVPSLDLLLAQLPAGSRYALIDDDQWGALQVLPGRKRVPFVELDGRWAGAPLDDPQAVAELQRQRTQGPLAVIFGPGCSWWMDHYAGFRRALSIEGRRMKSDGRFEGFLLD